MYKIKNDYSCSTFYKLEVDCMVDRLTLLLSEYLKSGLGFYLKILKN